MGEVLTINFRFFRGLKQFLAYLSKWGFTCMCVCDMYVYVYVYGYESVREVKGVHVRTVPYFGFISLYLVSNTSN